MSVDQTRVNALNEREPSQDGRFILYFMQHSQRTRDNPALERAAEWTKKLDLPLKVLFVVDPDYPDANARHYTFMLQGLKDVASEISSRGGHFALRLGNPPDVACQEAKDAAVVVTDRGYLRHLREWRSALAQDAPCLVEMVEGDVVVPVEAASDKKETAARTIRKKLHRAVSEFDTLPATTPIAKAARGLKDDKDRTLGDVSAFVDELGCDMSVGAIDTLKGGQQQAEATLKTFLTKSLDAYGDGRADIVNRNVSHLSPYLHFGQISPLRILHSVRNAKSNDGSKDAFIEEMLIRRELAVNFVHYEPDYDQFSALPGWAQDTLKHHAKDDRGETYSLKQLEDSKTDDPYWNAAMREMRVTGYLHNHLRMYWGKRIIAYVQDPKRAFKMALTLNNKYFLDGRDANSFANVAWLFGQHDRGWPERDVFGKVRTMMPSGLKRKFDIDAYVKWANRL